VALLSFFIIGVGSVGGGYLSAKVGSYKTAFYSLCICLLCCIFSPTILQLPFVLFVSVMLVWGMDEITDSPQFSTLVAQSAPAEVKGTALTIVNCIGFSITIVSLQLIGYVQPIVRPEWLFTILSLGPLLGLIAMKRKA
jgi:MFS family permease